MAEFRVIGVDPGSRRAGWGVVREKSGVLELVACGVIAPPLSGSFSARLGALFGEFCAVLEKYAPEAAAIEQAFVSVNAASALKLGQARGVAVAACAARNIEIFDYEPRLIKKSLVGAGAADKEQVAFMVARLLNVRASSWALDTTDALATAIHHLTRRRFLELERKRPPAGRAG